MLLWPTVVEPQTGRIPHTKQSRASWEHWLGKIPCCCCLRISRPQQKNSPLKKGSVQYVPLFTNMQYLSVRYFLYICHFCWERYILGRQLRITWDGGEGINGTPTDSSKLFSWVLTLMTWPFYPFSTWVYLLISYGNVFIPSTL